MRNRRLSKAGIGVIPVFGVVVALFILSGPTSAQIDAQGGDGQVFEYKKRTVINFEDDTITGDLKTPDGQYLEIRKKNRWRNLIRVRLDFKREVLGSFSQI